MNRDTVNYLTEASEWTDALKGTTTLAKLKAILRAWEPWTLGDKDMRLPTSSADPQGAAPSSSQSYRVYHFRHDREPTTPGLYSPALGFLLADYSFGGSTSDRKSTRLNSSH